MTTPSPPGWFLCCDREESEGFAADWDRLAALEPVYTPTFSDVRALFADPQVAFRLVGVSDTEGVRALGLFVLHAGTREYWLGEIRLLRLPVRSASLFGGNFLGAPDRTTAAAMIDRALDGLPIDLLVLDDLPTSSGLHALAKSGEAGVTRLSYHNTDRRLIALPATMDAYWAGFRSKTRRTALADLRSFERLKPHYEIFTGSNAIDDFLPRAAALSTRTYQNRIGQGLINTPHVQRHFARLADEGRLFCYLASVDGAAAAFGWGEIAHGIYYYRVTGYDPNLAGASAGKGILFYMIRDLIERKCCHSFDFGIRDMDYKHRFATVTVPCAHVLIARSKRPRGRVAIGLDRSLDFVKTTLPRWIGRERLRRIKRLLRGRSAND
jgi:hypothetical protein